MADDEAMASEPGDTLPRELREQREIEQADVLVVSFPKSGRTWLRLLLGKTLCDGFGLDESLMLDPLRLTAQANLPPVLFTHDGSSNKRGKRFDELGTDRSVYREKKVAYLTRNPLDVLVSCYFEATRRKRVFRGSLAEFLRHDRYGLRKILVFNRIWEASRHQPKAFLLLRYEDVHASPVEALRALLGFLGARELPEETLGGAVSYATFGNMRELERSRHFRGKRMAPRDVNDEESYKTRRGKIRGYTDYLDERDLAYARELIDAMGCPFYTEAEIGLTPPRAE